MYQPVQPMRLDRPRVGVGRIVVGVLAAVGVGLALTLLVLSWGALAAETGGSCGGTYQNECPQGLSVMLTLSIISLFILVPVMFGALLKTAKIGCVSALAAIAVGIYPGLAIFNGLHGKTLGAVWQAPYDQGTNERASGSWGFDGTVVRARFDGLIAYDVATGHQRWTFPVPGQQVLCGMGRHLAGGVGLVAYALENQTCDQVAAIDTATGRQLWTRKMTGNALPSSLTADVFDVAGQIALLRTATGVDGVDVRTGVKRWSQRAGMIGVYQCWFNHVTGGTDQVLTEVECPLHPPSLRMLDAATGRQRWDFPVPSQAQSVNVTLLSASPAVVHIQESGLRGTESVLSLDDTGRTRATIPMTAGSDQYDTGDHGFQAVPVRRLIVGGGVLVAVDRPAAGDYQLVGFDLADGHRAWSYGLGSDRVQAIQLDGARLVALLGSSSQPQLRTLTVADGKAQGGAEPLLLGDLTSELTVYGLGPYLAIVCDEGYAPWDRPISVIKRG
ncbi:MAG TPA: PQQ-binding-like beta-propeller repeat protein [Streptosporangiaceae bacterium]|nr:PQQ-binding-like beta-propeller repeat protein [Streptosporangiaceae bacterium]